MCSKRHGRARRRGRRYKVVVMMATVIAMVVGFSNRPEAALDNRGVRKEPRLASACNFGTCKPRLV
jgi:hypothetical protein